MNKSIVLTLLIPLFFSCGTTYNTTAGRITEDDRRQQFNEQWAKLRKGMNPWQVAELIPIRVNGTTIASAETIERINENENKGYGPHFVAFGGSLVPGMIDHDLKQIDCCRVRCPNGITLDFDRKGLVSWRSK